MSPKTKPFHGLGSGVMEIVANDESGTCRAVYAVSIGDSIYVIHAFQKKSKAGIATPKPELELIRQRHLTQADAAQLMGIDQPKVSAMLAGQFRGYSVERLMRFLVALGHDVEIVVKPRKRGLAELRVA
jgi:hypothetical protein